MSVKIHIHFEILFPQNGLFHSVYRRFLVNLRIDEHPVEILTVGVVSPGASGYTIWVDDSHDFENVMLQ